MSAPTSTPVPLHPLPHRDGARRRARRTVASALLASAACAVAFAPAVLGGERAGAAAGRGATAIRNVDFRNFTYVEDGTSYRVSDGEYLEDDGSGDRFDLFVRDVVFGDISGDGIEEAVVTTNVNTGGTGQFSEGRIYRWNGRTAAYVTSTGVGDRAEGGVFRELISRGVLREERYGPHAEGLCCPIEVTTTPLRLKGNRLVAAGRAETLALIDVQGASELQSTNTPELRFARGTSAAFVQGSTLESDRPFVDARAGQLLVIDEVDGPGVVHVLRDGDLLGSATPSTPLRLRLPSDGTYSLELVRVGRTEPAFLTFRLAIR